VLRYFESREAVLLELLDAAWQDWLTQLDRDLAGAFDSAAPVTARSGQLAGAVAAYEADPDLAALRLDFTETLGEVVEVMSAGLLARGGRNDRSSSP
jgi:AcrR family transcriptional regulator